MSDDPLSRVCNGCGAKPGQSCMAGMGKALPRVHMHRITGHRRSVEAANNNRIRNRESYRAKRAAL